MFRDKVQAVLQHAVMMPNDCDWIDGRKLVVDRMLTRVVPYPWWYLPRVMRCIAELRGWTAADVVTELVGMLCAKNAAYGDSALEPARIFSQAPASEAIRVRIDDKLSRLKSKSLADNEDTLMDLAGYMVLLILAEESSWRP